MNMILIKINKSQKATVRILTTIGTTGKIIIILVNNTIADAVRYDFKVSTRPIQFAISSP